MKKSLLALAVLGAFAGAASAQSSVTIYGFVDLALAKQIGSEDKEVWDSPDSRIGFRGTEDLGGGMKALFQFEHRFSADSGEIANARFWHAISMVGLSGGFGMVGLGRQYNGAWPVTNSIDPWGDDSVSGLRSLGVLGDYDGLGFGTDKRLDNSIRYESPTFGGFKFVGTIAEANGGDDRPYALSGVYAAGPLWIGVGYENPTNEDDSLLTFGAKYNFGTFGITGGVSKGTTVNDEDLLTFLIGGTANFGAGQLRVGYAQYKEDLLGGGEIKLKKASLGYYYSLSKRTTVYADVARGSKPFAELMGDRSEENGYGVGIRHAF